MKRLLSIFICTCTTLGVSDMAASDILPNDQPAIELLITCHKMMADAEDESWATLSTMTSTDAGKKTFEEKYKDVKSTLHKRLNDANSIMLMATTIVDIGLQLKSLISEYKNFETTTQAVAKKKPYVMATFVSANKSIIHEIKQLEKKVALFAAEQGTSFFNAAVFKSTNEEKYRMLCSIKHSVFKVRCILESATFKIQCAIYHKINGWDIAEVVDRYMMAGSEKSNKIIKEWNSHTNSNSRL